MLAVVLDLPVPPRNEWREMICDMGHSPFRSCLIEQRPSLTVDDLS
jgi:hypothetical protein